MNKNSNIDTKLDEIKLQLNDLKKQNENNLRTIQLTFFSSVAFTSAVINIPVMVEKIITFKNGKN